MSGNTVEIVGTNIVGPAAETPHHSIWLSGLDLLSTRRRYAPNIWVYRPRVRDAAAGFFFLKKLKESLSRTLVVFYPYAGMLGFGDDERIELKCDGGGVKVTEAVCDATLDMFGEFSLCDELRKQLVPLGLSAEPPCPVFMVQVTQFRCGSVCLGAMMHHSVVDGKAYTHFLSSWAAIARGVDPGAITPPHLDRTVLCARSPPRVEYNHTDSLLSPDSASRPSPRLSTATLWISKGQLAVLKGAIEGASTFTTVAAHAWRCVCRARGLDAGETTRLFIGVDIRSRLSPALPPEFLGNALTYYSVESGVSELLSGEAATTISKIEASKTRLTDSYLRSLIDFLEVEGGSSGVDRSMLRPNEIWATSWLHLPFSDIDFGWGRPTFAHPAEQPPKGHLFIMRSPNGDGEVQVLVTLEEDHMPAFKRYFRCGAKL